MARLFLERVEQVTDGLSEQQRTVVLAGALLHDVGHGPFSHAFESVTSESHERRTLQIIRDTGTEINRCLVDYEPTLPEHLTTFFGENPEEQTGAKTLIPPFLTQIVTSQLDADRFDYLLRDSYATGTQYGNFDAGWLILHTFVDTQKQRIYLSRKALMTAEAYVFGRYHMYRTVYFHKTTRAAEVMLRLILKRFKKMLDNGEQKAKLVAEATPRLTMAFSGTMTLGDYLQLDDCTMTEFFKVCADSDDEVLSELGAGLVHRRLFKATDVTDLDKMDVVKFSDAAKDKVKSLGLDPEFALVADTPGDTPYKPYVPDSEQPATQIYVERLGAPMAELSKCSKPVEQLTEKYTFYRYYYPDKIREEMEKIAQQSLRRA